MKFKGQGRKNNIVIRRNPEFDGDEWVATAPITDKCAVYAVEFFKQLQYEVKWISLAQWESKNF
jgi:hypothetical protein